MPENRAETLLNRHQKSIKAKYMFTTRDGKTFGTNVESEVTALRLEVLRYNRKLAKKRPNV